MHLSTTDYTLMASPGSGSSGASGENPPGAGPSLDRSLTIELSRQCQIGYAAWNRLDKLVREIHARPPEAGQAMIDAQIECFGYVQTILVCAGIVNSILWPRQSSESRDPDQRERSVARGNRLRQRLKVGSKSALYDRNLRNAVLHVDERFDDYFVDHPRDRIRDFSLVFDVPADWQPPPGVSVPRAYIFPGDVVVWFDERANLRSIALALRNLGASLNVPMTSVRRSDDGRQESSKGILHSP